MTVPPEYHLYYLQVPPELARSLGDFALDPSIPLPVESRSGKVPDLTELSWEQIVAAMLKIMAWERDHRDFGYYRDFILAVRPQIYQELSSTGIVKAQSKDFRLAEEVFLALEGLDPTNPRTQLNLALLYDDQAEFLSQKDRSVEAEACLSQAQKRFSQAMTATPPLPDAFFYAGFFHLKQKNLERARGLFDAFFELGRDESKINAARKALADYERRDNFDRLFKEAYDFILLGQEEKGIERIENFLADNPSVWNAWFLLGWAHRRLSHWSEALSAFEKALEREGDPVDLYNEMAICNMELGQLKEAQRLLEKALRRDGENTKILSNLGVLALRSGNRELARGFFESVLEYDPEDPLAERWLKELAHNGTELEG
ncbi:MAG: tetratricopeptide repeat protein [Spirochaetales bacterium]|nr:tetratricopeptide repeat protein [Spirochaetales bacterium]